MNDDPHSLSRLLKRWAPVTPPPTREFNAAVWARIAAAATPARSRSPLVFLSWRAAACWVAFASAFGGSAAAYAYDTFTRDTRMATAHARAIDPLPALSYAGLTVPRTDQP